MRWQQIGDIGEDWCWKPGFKLRCSSKEEIKEEEDLLISKIICQLIHRLPPVNETPICGCIWDFLYSPHTFRLVSCVDLHTLANMYRLSIRKKE